MAIASPGENLVLIKDNFKGFGGWRGEGATLKLFCAVPVFLHIHISFPSRMKNHFHIHVMLL